MDQEKIGKLIKSLRIEHNMTQDDLAKKLNVTPQAVSKWENGKNIPDISIIKDISKLYNIDINEFLDGNKKKNNKKYLIVILIIVALASLLTIIIINRNRDDFKLRSLSTTCSNFTLIGSAAFNSKKTSINISKIDYCGKENDDIYEEITCKLYKVEGNNKTLIEDCGSKKNTTISNYAESLEIKVDDYNNICSSINNLEIELSAAKNNTHTLYNIPIKIKEDCKVK